MPSAGIKMGDGVQETFEELHKGKKYKYLLFKIDFTEPGGEKGTDMVETEEKEPAKADLTQEEDYAIFNGVAQRLIKLNQPRYFIYDFNHTDDQGRKWQKAVFIFWCPDSYSGKLKMLYSTTCNDASKCFGNLRAIQANDADEIAVETIVAEVLKNDRRDSQISPGIRIKLG